MKGPPWNTCARLLLWKASTHSQVQLWVETESFGWLCPFQVFYWKQVCLHVRVQLRLHVDARDTIAPNTADLRKKREDMRVQHRRSFSFHFSEVVTCKQSGVLWKNWFLFALHKNRKPSYTRSARHSRRYTHPNICCNCLFKLLLQWHPIKTLVNKCHWKDAPFLEAHFGCKHSRRTHEQVGRMGLTLSVWEADFAPRQTKKIPWQLSLQNWSKILGKDFSNHTECELHFYMAADCLKCTHACSVECEKRDSRNISQDTLQGSNVWS